jgi:CRP/FNR family transcriptional regulator
MATVGASGQSYDGLQAHIGRIGAANASGRTICLRPVAAFPVGDEVMAELDRMGQVASYRRGRTVTADGDMVSSLLKVISGALRAVRLLPDGRRHIARFLAPGDFFGLAEIGAYSLMVEAIDNATVVHYPRDRFDALLEKDPQASRRFYSLMREQLSAAHEQLLLLGRKNALERMATFLLSMADRTSSSPSAGAAEVELPMGRADIADYLGLTIETVSRVLTYLRSRRVIDMPSAHRILFLDRECLEEIGAGEI